MPRLVHTVLLAGLALTGAPGATSAATSQPVALTVGRACAAAVDTAPDSRLTTLIDTAQSWGAERRAAFAHLLDAADTFGRAVAAYETDHSASDPCAARLARAAERRVFLRTLESVVADEAFDAALLTYREADGALNATYRDVMAVGDPQTLAWGSVDKRGIRRTERAWMAYRDAFVAFAATLDQPGAAERTKVELTARRATSLEAFLAD